MISARSIPSLGWYNQQLHQVLALNCKGEALAMSNALAAAECESARGVTAWYRLTRDHRGSSAQRILGLVGRVFQLQRCLKMSDIPNHLEVWKSRIREYEKLVFQTDDQDEGARQLQGVHRTQCGSQRFGQGLARNSSCSELQDHQTVHP